MKKAGKIVASIFAALGILVCVITLGISFTLQYVRDNPDSEMASHFDSALSDMEQDAPDFDTDDVDKFMEDRDFEKTITHSWVGALLFVIILVTVLINVPNMPFLTPAIAVVAAGGGAIFCGVGFMFLFVMALIGSVLVLVANLK